MCDYCDCRSIPEIGDLSADHEQVLELTRSLRGLVDDGRHHDEVSAALRELSSVLEPHTRREEAGIFAVLATIDCDPAYRQRFLDDHTDIATALEVAALDPSHVRPLIELIERHIFDEETDLYPAIRQLFAPSDWDDIHEHLHHHPRAAVAGTREVSTPGTGSRVV